MRIISGKYKGRVLSNFQADHIRPTTDRVKETLFNKWMYYMDQSKVLDLFSGTGSLGLEALSRGASHVTFVEKNVSSIKILKKNIELLKLASTEYMIIQKDVVSFLKNYNQAPFDLILVDPPFTEKMAHQVMLSLEQSQCVGTETLVAIESAKKEQIEASYSHLIRYDLKDYGDKLLSFFHKKEQIVDSGS